MKIKHIWCCTCGTETDCEKEDQCLGSVFQCPYCDQVWGCVSSKFGPKVWIKISESDAKFHRLLEKHQEEDE
jgi:hypothetical protein